MLWQEPHSVRVAINLASRPFADIAPALKTMRIATGVLALVALGLLLGLRAVHGKAEAARAGEHLLDAKIAQVRQEQQRYQALMRQPENARTLEEAENLCRNVAIIEGGRIIERDTMANVLRKLQTEVFVFNLGEPVGTPPALPGFRNEMTDDHTLEVEVSRGQSLNDIFSQLSSQGVRVNSMRNKVNRLEELFMRLVDHSARAVDKGV